MSIPKVTCVGDGLEQRYASSENRAARAEMVVLVLALLA